MNLFSYGDPVSIECLGSKPKGVGQWKYQMIKYKQNKPKCN